MKSAAKILAGWALVAAGVIVVHLLLALGGMVQ